MSTPVRAQDREHFSIVQDSLARDGLHVAMVAHDRRRLLDYAGALARALAAHTGLRVEAYHRGLLERIVVDLMLHRFDAALSDISAPGLSVVHARHTSATLPGCVLFVPEAHALSGAEFRQLLRIAAGTQRNGLRLVALFDADHPASDERVAALGTQVARWDLDDEPTADMHRASWRRGWEPDDDVATTGRAIGHRQRTSLPPTLLHKQASNGRRWLAAAGIATVLAALPALLALLQEAPVLTPTEARSVTRSGIVELAGEPAPAFARAQPANDAGMPTRDTEYGTARTAAVEPRSDTDVKAHSTDITTSFKDIASPGESAR